MFFCGRTSETNKAAFFYLHEVQRCTDLKPTLKFFKQIFGMKVLRHEENTEACGNFFFFICVGRFNICFFEESLVMGVTSKLFPIVCKCVFVFFFFSFSNAWSKSMVGFDLENVAYSLEITWQFHFFVFWSFIILFFVFLRYNFGV